MSPRLGFSLVELIVGMAITVTVMAVVGEALTSNRLFEGQQSAEDDLIGDAERVHRAISSDMSQSGWYSVPIGVFSSGTLVSVNAPIPLPSAGVSDRIQQYWPFAMTQRNAAVCTQYSLMKRTAAMTTLTMPSGLPGLPADATGNFFTAATAATLDGLSPTGLLATDRIAVANGIRTQFLKSWYAPSQELVFLKQIGDGGWNTIPSRRDEPRLAFSRTSGGTLIDWNNTSPATRAQLGVLYPNAYIKSGSTFGLRPGLTVVYGVPLKATVLDQTDSGKFTFRTSWQTIVAPTYDVSNLAVSTAAPDNTLRQYVYAVVPPGPTGTGVGRLVRAFKVSFSALGYVPATGTDPGQLISSTGTYGMMVDEVLSENCVRVVFDTARTDTTLALNQVRARIYLLRRSNADLNTLVRQVVEIHVTMRSRNSYTDRVATDEPTFTPATGVPGYVY